MKDRHILRARVEEQEEIERYRNRERQRKLRANGGRGVTAEEWQEMVDLCDNICIVPGCKGWPVTQDHVIPVSLGGLHEIENLQPICSPCNSRKGVQTIDYRPGTELERFIQ